MTKSDRYIITTLMLRLSTQTKDGAAQLENFESLCQLGDGRRAWHLAKLFENQSSKTLCLSQAEVRAMHCLASLDHYKTISLIALRQFIIL